MPTYIDTIICEDVRPELGNKVTLAGVFGEELVLPMIPLALPSLAIMQRWRATPEEADRGMGQFTFAIQSPNNEIQQLPPGPMPPLTKGTYVTTMSFIFKFAGYPIRFKGAYKFKTYQNNVPIHDYPFFVLTPADIAAQQARIGFKPPISS